LRRIMVVLSLVAMLVVAAAPAVAQVSQGFEEEDVESGDVEPSVDIASSGDQVNLCAAILQSANTGNVQNQQGVSQYLAYADDIEFEGSSIEITPEAVNECTQVIEQAAAAAAAPAKAAAPAPAPAPAAAQAKAGGAEAKAAPAPAPAPAPAQAKAGGAQAKALPPTGGISPLLAVGGGAALLTGGLLVRRIIG
jgi:cytoskeletal protein RodZ